MNNIENNNIKKTDKDGNNNKKNESIKEPKKLNILEIKISRRKKQDKIDKQSENSKKDDIK